MANFLLLYTGGSMPASPAETEAVMQAWGAWFGKIGSNLVDQGNPFTPKAKSISSNGTVSDGPVGELASGYRSEEHTSELQSHSDIVCRLLLEKKKKDTSRP